MDNRAHLLRRMAAGVLRRARARVRAMLHEAEPDVEFRDAAGREQRFGFHTVAGIEGLEAGLAGSGAVPTGLDAEVIGFFGDTQDKLYQLRQWLPIYEQLNQLHPVLLVFRDRRAFHRAKTLTVLPMICLRPFPAVSSLYAAYDYQVALYVNNGMRNFQSMSHGQMVHIHLDHGESDKTSSVSNQLKAYDRVFVAGHAARERIATLFDFDDSHIREIGRPPLDIGVGDRGHGVGQPRESTQRTSTSAGGVGAPVAPTTVLYAPTWPGESERNNFSSVDVLGSQIVSRLVADPRFRVVYKPHPRMTSTEDTAVGRADRAIRELLTGTGSRAAEHEVAVEADVVELFDSADVMITDISSVGLDFLYLCPQKGLILTDRHADPARLRALSPLANAVPLVDRGSVSSIVAAVIDSGDPEHMQSRASMREHYFGHLEPGASTAAFFSAIDEAIADRAAQRDARHGLFG